MQSIFAVSSVSLVELDYEIRYYAATTIIKIQFNISIESS